MAPQGSLRGLGALETDHGGKVGVVCTVGLLVMCAGFLHCSCMFEPEGNACSLTDSTAEEHVLALVEHAADEARDRISRLLPGSKVALPDGAGVSSARTVAQPSKSRG